MRVCEDECVDCGLPCIGDFCPNKNVTRYYCDECGREFDSIELYVFDGEELCLDCLLSKFKTVEDTL